MLGRSASGSNSEANSLPPSSDFSDLHQGSKPQRVAHRRDSQEAFENFVMRAKVVGKSGGYRVIHFYSGEETVPIFLITIFAKNEKVNLTTTETEIVKSLGKALADRYRSKP